MSHTERDSVGELDNVVAEEPKKADSRDEELLRPVLVCVSVLSRQLAMVGFPKAWLVEGGRDDDNAGPIVFARFRSVFCMIEEALLPCPPMLEEAGDEESTELAADKLLRPLLYESPEMRMAGLDGGASTKSEMASARLASGSAVNRGDDKKPF